MQLANGQFPIKRSRGDTDRREMRHEGDQHAAKSFGFQSRGISFFLSRKAESGKRRDMREKNVTGHHAEIKKIKQTRGVKIIKKKNLWDRISDWQLSSLSEISLNFPATNLFRAIITRVTQFVSV